MGYIERASELRRLLTEYQKAYYVTGRPLVSDLEYDGLFDELVLLEKEHPELKMPFIIRNHSGRQMAERLDRLIKMLLQRGHQFTTYTSFAEEKMKELHS